MHNCQRIAGTSGHYFVRKMFDGLRAWVCVGCGLGTDGEPIE